jgi:hypothetical protein
MPRVKNSTLKTPNLQNFYHLNQFIVGHDVWFKCYVVHTWNSNLVVQHTIGKIPNDEGNFHKASILLHNNSWVMSEAGHVLFA